VSAVHPLVALVLACAVIGTGYQLFQLFAAWRFLRRRTTRPVPAVLPPVTVLKPLKGLGVELYENLASFCRQDYPAPCQIVFGVEEATDPAVAVVRRLEREFPAADIVLSVAAVPGANRKVANLCHMTRHARHDLLVLSDGDIRVRPDYLRTMVAPLADPAADPRLALTTCLYRGVARIGFPAEVEALFINTDFIPMVLTAQLVQRFRYAYGASIAVRRQALERIGGFPALADYLADDYQLGNRLAKAGFRLRLLPYVVDTVLDSVTLGDVWRHQLRWARTYRVCQPAGWFFSVLTHTVLWGVLAAVVTGGSTLGWGLFGAALTARLTSLAAILGLLGDAGTRRRLAFVPAKDLVTSTVWLAAFLGREVTWSGQVLRVEADGRMLPVPQPVLVAREVEVPTTMPERAPAPPP
jgi:ceramide glucosyltransferase